ncbi:MAG: Acetoin:2,6-dichlorophenolindophenol oxidoreductase subunit alpha [Chlamydiia bacterium]|nr:Acetoin:2,6-dichlorophenolindophenol oxidoreductase subunit alpha [Chlamydiia bacterium]
MSKEDRQIKYNFLKADAKKLLKDLGKDRLKEALRSMMKIRNFEVRAESAYQHGKVGGFFHSYIGQEAIQTACVAALGQDPWYTTTYRCHALALLLGVTVDEAMAELYGKETGNAKGRGGSMHFFSDKLLGGYGIVGGHLPIALGAAFSLKYQNKKSLSVCFLGDGSVAQGLFHESLNLGTLWELPAVYVVENNQWGMGTGVNRAICNQPIAENFAKGYGISSYTANGMDYFDCYNCFEKVQEEVLKTSKPVLVELVTERFKGHSVSDPALYRSKEELQKAMKTDPILLLSKQLVDAKMLTEEEVKTIDKEEKDKVIAAMKFAEESAEPCISTLEEGVFASEERE